MNFKRLFVGETNNTFIQFFRYCFVGGFAFVVNAGTLVLLVEIAGLDSLISNIIGFIFGLIVNYVLSTFWIFKNSKISDKKAEFIAFAVIGLIGLVVDSAIVKIFDVYIGPKQPLSFIPEKRYYQLGKLISTGVVFVWNFAARKFIIFNKE